MSKLGERVRTARESIGWDQKALGDEVGYGQSTIADIERGATSSPRGWRKLADKLAIPHDEFRQLMLEASRESGKVTRLAPAVRDALAEASAATRMDADDHDAAAASYDSALLTDGIKIGGAAPRFVRVRNVPVYGRAAGGDDGKFEFNGEILGWESRPPQLEGVATAYCIYVSGVSMYPRYRDGETAWVNPNRPAKRGDDVVVQFYPDEEDGIPSGFVKELVGYRGSKLVLAQHNPPKELEFDRNRVKSIHLIEFAQR